MDNADAKGLLKREPWGGVFYTGDGTILRNTSVWNGYLRHWEGLMLNGTVLPERDYNTGREILLLWPDEPKPENYFELYYNERLVKYRMSFLGHLAINVNGRVYNFSHLINECEVMTEAEYLYRPALGRFAPSPSGYFDISDPQRPFLDKFGRQFMRTIHTLRVTGTDNSKLESHLIRKMKEIHESPVDVKKPDYWSGFRTFSDNCTTAIRDALRGAGFTDINGVFPHDLFISAVWSIRKRGVQPGLSYSVFSKDQLKVDEAPCSALSPVINPINRIKRLILKLKGISV